MNAGAGNSSSDSDKASTVGKAAMTLGAPRRPRTTAGISLFDESESDEISMGLELAAGPVAMSLEGISCMAEGNPDCWGE